MAQKPKNRRRVPSASLSRVAYLRAALRQYEELAIEAEDAGSWGPAKDAKREAVATRAEIDRLLEQEARARAPSTPEAHEAEILHEVRRLRQQAPAYAAAGLLRLEHDLLAARAAEARAAEAAKFGGLSTAELEAEAERLRAEREPGTALRVVK